VAAGPVVATGAAVDASAAVVVGCDTVVADAAAVEGLAVDVASEAIVADVGSIVAHTVVVIVAVEVTADVNNGWIMSLA
jgi:hypothetical protein